MNGLSAGITFIACTSRVIHWARKHAGALQAREFRGGRRRICQAETGAHAHSQPLIRRSDRGLGDVQKLGGVLANQVEDDLRPVGGNDLTFKPSQGLQHGDFAAQVFFRALSLGDVLIHAD